jgi:hypothetical protein
MTRRVLSSVALALLLGVLAVSPAQAAQRNILNRVQHAYEARGVINPCQFTSQELSSALKSIDTYGAQYFADFSNAVQSALDARATGACSAPNGAATTHRSPSKPLAPVHVGSATAATNADVPAPLLLLAMVALLAALTGGLVALGWWRGWSAAWAGPWRHLWSEAGFRLEGSWLEFRDWLRSGSR